MPMSFEQYAHARLPVLLRAAEVICRDKHLAEDLVQDVLIKVHARWAGIGDLESRDAYVHRMLVNEYLSWRRKWARLVPQRDPEPSGAAADHAAVHAERTELQERIARLPAKQRIVVVLRYLVDVPDSEIAAALGCAESTVRVHAARALASLRAGFPVQLEGTIA
jgi:RNA polymerase sigma-70 factor (sigma-E family)